jgi:hypothetical protein
MKIRNQELIEVFDDNPFIIAGYSAKSALATGKSGDDTARLADALVGIGDPAELIEQIEAAVSGTDIGEYVGGGDACYIVLTNQGAVVCFETAHDDEEYPFSLEQILPAVRDWQRAWEGSHKLVKQA